MLTPCPQLECRPAWHRLPVLGQRVEPGLFPGTASRQEHITQQHLRLVAAAELGPGREPATLPKKGLELSLWLRLMGPAASLLHLVWALLD